MMGVELAGEARARLDAHLDAVESALVSAGKPRLERRAVMDDLEAQVLDMLAARSSTATVSDVEAVLATLDPPSAYGGEAGAAKGAAPPLPPPSLPMQPRYSRTAIWGLVCILASFLPVLILLPLLFFFSAPFSSPHSVHSEVRETLSKSPDRVQPVVVRAQKGPVGPVVVEAPAESEPASPTTQVHVVFQERRSWAGQLLNTLPCVFVLIGPLGLLGTVLGWVAFGQIRRSKGAIRGTGLALFDGLFYPVLAGLVLLAAVCLAA